MKSVQSKSPASTAIDWMAFDWLIRLRFDEVSSETLSEWTRWLEAPGAREAYDRALQAWSLCGLAWAPRPTEEDLREDAYDGAVPVAAWRERPQQVAPPLMFSIPAQRPKRRPANGGMKWATSTSWRRPSTRRT